MVWHTQIPVLSLLLQICKIRNRIFNDIHLVITPSALPLILVGNWPPTPNISCIASAALYTVSSSWQSYSLALWQDRSDSSQGFPPRSENVSWYLILASKGVASLVACDKRSTFQSQHQHARRKGFEMNSLRARGFKIGKICGRGLSLFFWIATWRIHACDWRLVKDIHTFAWASKCVDILN